jgi:putative ABC transport system permease protein
MFRRLFAYVMGSFFQDLKFGARILRKSPGITIAVILALTLGIGANSAMFSLVDALLLHPLSVHDPGSLVVIATHDGEGGTYSASAADYIDWRKQSKSFTDLAGWETRAFVMTGGDRPVQLPGSTVTANFFRTLDAKPVLGRTFLPDEDGINDPASASKVVVISYRLWQNTFGGDPNVLGHALILSGISYAVIGVMPPDFRFLWRNDQVWIPIPLDRGNRDYHGLRVIGRLKTGRGAASSEMAAIERGLAEQYPKSDKGWTTEVGGLEETLVAGSLRTRVLQLFGTVGLILLIACGDVASLLLARSAARNREIAVRLSLGATRARLTRQLLTESVLLASAGGAAGLGLAWSLIRFIPVLVPVSVIPSGAPIRLNELVIYYTVGVAIATGVLFGLAPALASTRPDVQSTLKDASRGTSSGRGRQRLRQILVTGEIAVALVLLASAGLMIESLRKMSQVDLGFDPNNVLTLRVFLPSAKFNPAKALQFHREAIERIAALPGVESVGLGSHLPLQPYRMDVPFDLESAPPRTEGERPGVDYITVTEGYMSAMHMTLERGRGFTSRDDSSAPPVVVVNESFARHYFQNENPVGKHLLLNRPILGKDAFEDPVHPEIVGVMHDVKQADIGADVAPCIYAPHAQNAWSPGMWLVIRAGGDPARLTAAIRREVLKIDKDQPVGQLGSMEQILSSYFAEPRLQTDVMGAFALVALLLAVVGIYGVNSYMVTERRLEIGVRIALGATPASVAGAIVMQGMKLAGMGIAIGLAGSIAAASALRGELVGVSATDPVTLAGVALLLATVAALACYIPAHRATRIEPAVVLRGE